jgi:AcrR family transcriptional regulator
MTPAKVARARELYKERALSVVEIATALGVSRASIYRHVVPHKSSTSSE